MNSNEMIFGGYIKVAHFEDMVSGFLDVDTVKKRFLIFHQRERQVLKINRIFHRYSNDMTTALDQKSIPIYDCL